MSRTEIGNGDDSASHNFNTFYKAPIGKENWKIKHIEPKHTCSNEPAAKNMQRRLSMLPEMRPTVMPYPAKYVTRVIKNHYRTSSVASESSARASQEVRLSKGSVR